MTYEEGAMNTARPRRDPGRGYAYGGPALIGGTLVGVVCPSKYADPTHDPRTQQ